MMHTFDQCANVTVTHNLNLTRNCARRTFIFDKNMHFVGISIIQPKLGCCIVYIWQECVFIYAASRMTINAISKLVFQLLSIFGPHYKHRFVVAAEYLFNNCGFE